MHFNPQTGRINQARWTPSPNYDGRTHPDFINTLVIHAISLPPDCFGNSFVEDFFCNQLDNSQHPYFKSITHLNVSSHFYIKRDGELLQFVTTADRAWHADAKPVPDERVSSDFKATHCGAQRNFSGQKNRPGTLF
jgi:AmpD protein